MNSNEKKLNISLIEDDLDKLSKNIYLESPDLWIEYLDKINDNKFDEMVIFFACKYNYLNIVKFLIDSNFIDLNSPSRNTSFDSIGEHLLFTTKQNDKKEIYDYLYEIINNTDSKSINTDNMSYKQNNLNIPKFICSKCKTNLFESGYRVLKGVTYKYSQNENKPIIDSEELLDSITCCNCNSVVQDATIDLLESLCSLQNCSKCGVDLTKSGIVDKTEMIYDKTLNKFINNGKSYNCANCGNELNEHQEEHFHLNL